MSAVDEAVRDVEVCRRAHRRLLARLDDVLAAGSDGGAGRFPIDGPTRLDGWSRAELVTHLARNADGHRRIFDAAAVGDVADQYPGGSQERDGGIAAGRGRSAAAVVDDLRTATRRLEEAWAATEWNGAGRRGGRSTTPLTDLPFLRLREIELHHVDLDVGAEFEDLDPTYVRLESRRLTMRWTARQPMGLTGLPAAVLDLAPHDRLAWLTGRRRVDGLATPELF